MRDYVNPANAITAARYLALPAFLYWLDRGDIHLATLAIVYCGVLDLFDGAVARKFNCTSGFGELFDAVTDALCYGYFMVCLTVYDMMPVIPVVGIIVLGVYNTYLRVAYARRVGRTTNYRSYAMERVVGFAAYLAGFGISGVEPVFFSWLCFGIMGFVLIHDTKRMLVDPVPA